MWFKSFTVFRLVGFYMSTHELDRDHPGQHGETPSLLKIQKLAGHGGMCL